MMIWLPIAGLALFVASCVARINGWTPQLFWSEVGSFGLTFLVMGALVILVGIAGFQLPWTFALGILAAAIAAPFYRAYQRKRSSEVTAAS